MNKLNEVMGNHKDVMFETLVNQSASGLEFIGKEGGKGAVNATIHSTIEDSEVGLQAPVVKVVAEETVTSKPDETTGQEESIQ